MKRFALTTVLVAALGSSAGAQPVPVPNPDPVPPAPTYTGPAGPPVAIHKSGGTVVGTDGYFPYDSGLWLLAETKTTRQSGWYTMVYPGGNVVPTYGPTVAPARGHFGGKHGLFRR